MRPKPLLNACLGITVLTACHETPTGPRDLSVHIRWSESQIGGSQSRPLVLDNVAYFGTGFGEIVARDVGTGSVEWSTQAIAQSEVAALNLLVRRDMLIAAGVWTVSGIDAGTGVFRWSYTTPLDTVDTGSPAPGEMIQAYLDADSSRVYIPAWGASVSAVDVQTGHVAWIWQPGRAPTDTAANVFRSGATGVRVSGDSVFVNAWHFLDRFGAHSEYWLVLLDRTSGRELARLTVPSQVSGVSPNGAPVLYRDLVILTGRGGKVWGVDRSAWQIKWQFTPVPQFFTAAGTELYGDSLYVDGGDGSLYALAAIDGSLLWKVAAADGYASRDLLVTDKRIYYPDFGAVKVLDRMSGVFVAEFDTTDPLNDIIDTPPAFSRGRVFLATTRAAVSFDEP